MDWMSKRSITSGLSFSVLCLIFFLTLTSARPQRNLNSSAAQKVYIVYLGTNIHGDTHDLTMAHHRDLLQTLFESAVTAQQSVVHHYKSSFSGFAARLTEQQASKLRDHPDVVSVFESRTRKLATTFSWKSLGLDASSPDNVTVWNRSHLGDGVIIGLLDTGVWPESESFRDAGLGPVPSKWKGGCDEGVSCNRKLIGARVLLKEGNDGSPDSKTPRDGNGHGTHTSSTAGGNFVANASVFGIAQGTASGGAPNAHIAMYKVCTAYGACADSDILAGFDRAVADGVDVLSVSLGIDSFDLETDAVAIGSFHALTKNVLVVAAGGNEGPSLVSVENTAPWLLTVAASSVPRDFATTLELGNGEELVDKAKILNIFATPEKIVPPYPLIRAADAHFDNTSTILRDLCLPSIMDPKRVKGKIVLCRFQDDFGGGGTEAALVPAGAAGQILARDAGDEDFYSDVVNEPSILPTILVSDKQKRGIVSYINSTGHPAASIRKTETLYHRRPGPEVASFSSRGPSPIAPDILKPDLSAPGLNILAAWPPNVPVTGDYGPGVNGSAFSPFNIISGTSMATPHVAGVAALIKAIYPSWSVAAIKSALITTAKPLNTSLKANSDGAYGFGAGEIDPAAAADPGLVYDADVTEHVLFLCGLGLNSSTVDLITGTKFSCPQSKASLPRPRDFNYPSVAFTTDPRSRGTGTRPQEYTVTRTVTNVTPAPAVYDLVAVESPPGTQVSVVPQQLSFTSVGQQLSFNVTVTVVDSANATFGSFTWSDHAGHNVRSPLVVLQFEYCQELGVCHDS